jgi:hypothetical protein
VVGFLRFPRSYEMQAGVLVRFSWYVRR